MNINFTLECETCGEHTNVRFGMSGRTVQPVRFACKSCGSPIDIVLDKKDGSITGAFKIEGKAPFDAETNFVDLHLDFPVSFEPYERGNTPFMRAAARVEHDQMMLHGSRLRHLNDEMAKARDFHNILKLYAKQRLAPFTLNISRVFGIEVRSNAPQDVNAALYTLIGRMMAAYEYPGQSVETVESFNTLTENLACTNKPALESFVSEVIENGFLKNLQLDALEIYPKMLAAELVMRPALFLDFDAEYAANPIPLRVSSEAFEAYKDLYKDISEIISRQLVLVAGLNNLDKRGDHNAFAPVYTNAGRNRAPTNLQDYANVAFGTKTDSIDDSWYAFLDDSMSNQLRNAIAHYKTEYDDITQIVTYYPKMEGMEQVRSETIYFLEFARRLLVSYREMHRLHHLAKVLFYYFYLVMMPAR